MGHDQRFKLLLQTFLQDFLKLFYPDVEARLDFQNVEFLSTEVFTDVHAGKRREADVVAKLSTRDGRAELVLIHVEIQSRPEREFRARMFEYFSVLWSRYRLPIFPIVVYLQGRGKGLTSEQYRLELFGREVLRFRYESIRLARLDAEEYLGRGSPVGAALAALMDRSESRDVEQMRVSMKLHVIHNELDPAREFLLIDLIETYFPLSAVQTERYNRLISRKEYRKVQEVELSWADKLRKEGEETGLKTGLLKGKRQTLSRLLAAKFGPLPEWATSRVEAIDSVDELDSLVERVLTATSLDEMGLH